MASGAIAFAEDAVDPTAVKSEDGKYLDKEGNPTFKVAPDGTVDWYTYSGYRRYHSECHVCHGPDGMGSTYAPALKDSLKTMSYGDFLGVVASGRKNVNTAQENVMPAFGDNPNVACYMDDLYVYLRARANDAVGRAAAGEAREQARGLRQGGEFLHGQSLKGSRGMKTRAAVAFQAKKPLEIVELDLDGPKAGEVLVEIKATGICHTDAYTLDGFDSEGNLSVNPWA